MKAIGTTMLVLAMLATPVNAVSHQTEKAAAPTMADGEVRKVDKAAAKITLRHGEIKNLDMPAMTMVFAVKDKNLLDQVKVGDTVRFSADKIGGVLTITDITQSK